ncbi:MAG TPA: LiaF domain-containing protein [Vicinamibacteria bacterium]|nr:LiaF domain-containing protein [Vicinamibacteria bacterium]
MSPEPTPEKPGDAFAANLRERIVRDAQAAASGWERAGWRGNRITPRLVVGLSIMTAGLILALDSLGLVDGAVVLRWWPLVLITVGVVKWTSTPHQASSGFVWIAAGIGFLLVSLGRMSFGGVWAMVLFFVGANIAWRALWPPLPRLAGDDAFDMVAVLGGAKTGITSTEAEGVAPRRFRGGRAMAVMGGCEIDLRRASIPEGQEAQLDVFVMWGGIEIKVPEEWEVVNRGSAFLGGFENKTRSLPSADRRLVVTGTAIMGGVEVKN